jgi:hypothetical protein
MLHAASHEDMDYFGIFVKDHLYEFDLQHLQLCFSLWTDVLKLLGVKEVADDVVA